MVTQALHRLAPHLSRPADDARQYDHCGWHKAADSQAGPVPRLPDEHGASPNPNPSLGPTPTPKPKPDPNQVLTGITSAASLVRPFVRSNPGKVAGS